MRQIDELVNRLQLVSSSSEINMFSPFFTLIKK